MPWRATPWSVPWPLSPWQYAQSRWYRYRPSVLWRSVGGMGPGAANAWRGAGNDRNASVNMHGSATTRGSTRTGPAHPLTPPKPAHSIAHRSWPSRVGSPMMRKLIAAWPAARQLSGDLLGLGKAVKSERYEQLMPRTAEADAVVRSVCPYCAVGCGQRVFVQDGRITQIEGDPDSPISRGRLCPKGSATKSLVTNPARE